MDEPTQRLPREARSYWRLKGGVEAAGAFVVAMFAIAPLEELAWLGFVAVAVFGIVRAGIVPELRWRRWRYEVREEEIDLMHGAFVMRRTLIPIRRVQHVDTEAGPLQGSFDLTTVTFHTAAGGVEIPALARGAAESVRARVAELARTRDDS